MQENKPHIERLELKKKQKPEKGKDLQKFHLDRHTYITYYFGR